MLTKFFKQSWLALVCALAFGLLVAAVHGALEGKIEQNEKDKLNREVKALLTDAATFDEHLDENDKLIYLTGKDKNGTVVGHALIAVGGGFADKIHLLVAVDPTVENLLGIAVLKSQETPGFGDKIKDPPFKGQYACPAGQKLTVIKTGDRDKVDNEIVAISGATISSEAVTKIVNNALIEIRELLKK